MLASFGYCEVGELRSLGPAKFGPCGVRALRRLAVDFKNPRRPHPPAYTHRDEAKTSAPTTEFMNQLRDQLGTRRPQRMA